MKTFLALLAVLTAMPSVAFALPTGNVAFNLPVECRPENAWRELDGGKAKRLDSLTRRLQEKIEHCEPYWRGNFQPSITSLIDQGLLSYPTKHPYLRILSIPLADGRTLRGGLAVKPGVRDLVVVRCGMFCNGETGPLGMLSLMSFFEENPVNLLILNSTTGTEFAKANGSSYMGPFDEGFQNLEAARYIYQRQAQFGLKVRDIRIAGMSLGGLSTLFSSVYYNVSDQFTGLPVKSFLALCPLVDAKVQFNKTFQNPLSVGTMIFNYFLGSTFKEVLKVSKGLRSAAGPDAENLSPAQQLEAGLKASARFYDQNWSRLGFSNSLMKIGALDREALLYTSSILPFAEYFSANTLVLHADDDQFVPWDVNGLLLRGRVARDFGLLHTETGNHCAFPQALSWPVFSHFLTHALDQSRLIQQRKVALPATLAEKLEARGIWENEKLARMEWNVTPQSNVAVATLLYFQEQQPGCDGKFTAIGTETRACFVQEKVEVPLSEMRALGMPAKSGDIAQANRIERYLNIHTRPRGVNGRDILGTSNNPEALEADGHFDARVGIL